MSKMKLSKSSVNSFIKCRREFKYQYIDKIKGKKNKFLLFGSFIHDIAENIAKELQKKTTMNIDIITEVFAKYYPHDHPFDVEDVKTHMNNLYAFFVEAFVNNNYKIFSIEEYILDTENALSGLSDLVLENNNGDLIVIDYKTGRTKPITSFRLELCYYKRLIEFKYPDKKVVTAGIFFTKDKGYRFLNFAENQKKGAYITQEDYNSALEMLDFVRSEVDKGRLSPSRQYNCRFCTYKNRCEKDGGF